MKLFIDTANLVDIEWGLKTGMLRGVTTNPSILAKEPKGNYIAHLARIVELLHTYVPREQKKDFSFSVEVFSDDPVEIVRQAEEFRKELSWPGLAIKVHVDRDGKDNLAVVNQLAQSDIAVNCTACMTAYQATCAAAAGAKFVSLFWGRIRDGGKDERFSNQRAEYLTSGKIREQDFDPAIVVRETRTLIDHAGLTSEIIAGSIRRPLDVKDASLAGAHIVTVQPHVLKGMLGHYKTDEVVEQFFADFKSWMS